MNERRDPKTGELLETVDLVPIILAFIYLLLTHYMDKPCNVKHVLCNIRTIIVCITHMFDERINVSMDLKNHYKECNRILGIGKTSVYNYNEEYKTIPKLERFCDFETIFQILKTSQF